MHIPTLFAKRQSQILPVPQRIAGLNWWLDASDSNSITADGSQRISQWNDKSGNLRHAQQLISLEQPQYDVARKVVLHDATRSMPVLNNLRDIFSISVNYSFACVFKLTDLVNDRIIFSSTIASANRFVIMCDGTGTLSNLIVGAWNGTIWTRKSVGVTLTNRFFPLIATWDGTNMFAWLDGIEMLGTSSPAASNTAGARVGARTDNINQFQGELAEYCAYSRVITATERGDLTTYLKRWDNV
jgi:hypothetical protein